MNAYAPLCVLPTTSRQTITPNQEEKLNWLEQRVVDIARGRVAVHQITSVGRSKDEFRRDLFGAKAPAPTV